MKKGRHDSYTKYKRKNLFYRTTPWLIAIGGLLLIAIVVWGIYHFIQTRPEDVEEIVYEEIEESTLPVLTMSYNGRSINSLSAYSDEMDLNYAAQAIFLLEDTYELEIEIDLKDNSYNSVDFYLYDMDNSSLIQNSQAENLSLSDGVLFASLVMDQVISNDTEYVLDIILTLDTGDELHFYTRILRSSGTYIADEIELAYSFTQATISKDQDAISSYMETNPWTQSNSNFSGVNLKSSLNQMTWQSMDVSLLGDISVTILDINDTIGCFRLDYILTRQDGDTVEYYRVSDYFRIRMTASASYILSYERSVDEIFIPTEELLSTSSAELGILSSDDIETAASSDGAYSCFVIGGTLYQMASSQKELIQIFSFEAEDPAESTVALYDHDIEILSVDSSGDVEFLVYGYMNAGLHEGLCGVGLYFYSAESGQVTEELFIQADVPYEILKETAGDMIYVTDEDLLYILIDQTIYNVSLDTYTLSVVAQGLSSGSYKVSLSGEVIAWQNDGSINDAQEITILDAQSGETITISAAAGTSIKILGFIGEDLVYGIGQQENYFYDDSDDEYLLMDTVCVVNMSGEVENEYVSDSGYFLSAEYEYNRIIISKDSGDDLTVYSSEISAVSIPEISSDYEDTKQTVYYVSFIKSTTSSGDFTITTDIPVYVTESDLVKPNGFLELSGRYLVYGKGYLVLITSSASEAVSEAYEYEGYVKTENGYFYRRGMRSSSISMSDSAIEAALKSYEDGDLTLISGITLTQALYFTGEGIALIWEYDGDIWLIYGYDSGDDLLVYNVETGETGQIDDDEAEDAFDNSEGSLYVVTN